MARITEQTKPRNKENVKPKEVEDRNNNSIINNNNKKNNDNFENVPKKPGKRSRKRLNKNKPQLLDETTTPMKTRKTTAEDKSTITNEVSAEQDNPVITTSIVPLAVPISPSPTPHLSTVISKTTDVFEDSVRNTLLMNDEVIFFYMDKCYVLTEDRSYYGV